MRTIAFWLSVALIFMIPWEAMIVLPGLGTLTRATGLLVAGVWVISVLVTGELRKLRPFHVAVYLFIFWNVLSAFWSMDLDLTLTLLLTYFQLLALVWLVWDLYATPAALRAGLQAYVLGAYVSIGSTVANYLAGRGAIDLRYAATGFDENQLGLILALGIPVAWHLAVSESDGRKARLLQFINYCYVAAALFAILLTGSRASLIAAFPALLFILASLGRLGLFRSLLISVALILALLALQPLVPASSLHRFSTIGTSIAAADLGGRVAIWREGLTVFSEHPLVGVGSGAFRAATESGHVSHNVFLSVLVDLGLVGFVLFTIILAIAGHNALKQPRWESRFWVTVLIIWALGSFTLNWEYAKPTWLFLSLVVVAANLARGSAKVALGSDLVGSSTDLSSRAREEVYGLPPAGGGKKGVAI
jgi:O-antigen ligase